MAVEFFTCFNLWKRSRNEPSLENTLAGFGFTVGADLDEDEDADAVTGGTTTAKLEEVEGLGEADAYPFACLEETLDIERTGLQDVETQRISRKNK